MARAGKKTYYWDSSAFIAWVDGGKGHPKEVIEGLDAIAKEINENRAVLTTSVMTDAELLQGKLIPEQATKFQNLFKRRNVTAINVDSRIAKKASEIRNYYNERKMKLSTPDSIHLATAIIYEVDEFHTLDGDGPRQRTNDLLRLNGNVAGHSLHIRVPIAAQSSLFSGVEPLLVGAKPTGEIVEQKVEQKAEPSTPQIQRGSERPSESQATEAEIKDSKGEVKM
jgi:predicted nucleic acid-binding protein